MSGKGEASANDFAHVEVVDPAAFGEPEAGRRLTVANAQHAAEEDKEQTVLQSIKNYPSAVCWSLLVSLLVVMEGRPTV